MIGKKGSIAGNRNTVTGGKEFCSRMKRLIELDHATGVTEGQTDGMRETHPKSIG